MAAVDLIIVVICSSFTVLVLAVNVFLLILMTRHTPKSFANFGIVMKFHVVSDIQTILAAAAGMSRAIPIDNSIVYVAYGPCTSVSSSACFIAYSLMALGGSMTLYIVLVSFIVRLQIMKNKRPSDRSIIALLAVLTFIVPAVILVLFLRSRSDDSIVRKIIFDRFPDSYVARNATVFGFADVRAASLSIALALMIIAIIPLYFIILILRSKILECLSDTRVYLSERTKSMHSQFVKMLTLQCIVSPVVFFTTLVPIALERFDVIRDPIVEAMINVLACLSTLLSPLIVIFYINPYRKALCRLLESKERHTLSTNLDGMMETVE